MFSISGNFNGQATPRSIVSMLSHQAIDNAIDVLLDGKSVEISVKKLKDHDGNVWQADVKDHVETFKQLSLF
jgi:hypothetical protein